MHLCPTPSNIKGWKGFLYNVTHIMDCVQVLHWLQEAIWEPGLTNLAFGLRWPPLHIKWPSPWPPTSNSTWSLQELQLRVVGVGSVCRTNTKQRFMPGMSMSGLSIVYYCLSRLLSHSLNVFQKLPFATSDITTDLFTHIPKSEICFHGLFSTSATRQ